MKYKVFAKSYVCIYDTDFDARHNEDAKPLMIIEQRNSIISTTKNKPKYGERLEIKYSKSEPTYLYIVTIFKTHAAAKRQYFDHNFDLFLENEI